VALGAPAEEAQIALTPAGQPRVLFRVTPTDGSFFHPYYYAACDTGCTSPTQWATTKVAQTSATSAEDFYMPQRSFALDSLGRPRFVYYTGDLGDPRKGAFYAYCDADCTLNDPASPHWHETQISYSDGYSYEVFNYPALAFTPQNQPRVISSIYGQQNGVHYLACDAACDDPHSWGRTYLLDRGFGPMASWDIEVDGAGRPRVVVYQEGFDDGSGDQLIYGWCDANCLDESNWAGSGVGLPQGEGEDPDLELDQQGRPRIAYHAAGAAGLGYLWCNTGCQSSAGQWQSSILEPSADLDAAFPIPVPSGCERAAWSGGFRPVLSLDAQGNPRVGSDAERMMSCFYQDPLDPNNSGTRVETFKHARFVFAPQP
jgi:hypothetical protein